VFLRLDRYLLLRQKCENWVTQQSAGIFTPSSQKLTLLKEQPKSLLMFSADVRLGRFVYLIDNSYRLTRFDVIKEVFDQT